MAVSGVNGGAIPLSPNIIINGAFDIWQRGAGPFSSTGYTADRWRMVQGNANQTVTRQNFTPSELSTASYGESRHYARWSLATGAQFSTFTNVVEDVRTFAGQTITISFWAKGTNPASGSFVVNIGQNFGTGGSAEVFVATQDLTVSSTWQRFSFSFNVPSVSGKTIGENSFLRIPNIYQPNVSSAASSLDIWGVQVEAGSVATPFRRNANSLEGELAACQRYFYRFDKGTAPFAYVGTGFVVESTQAKILINHPVVMRAPGAITVTNPSNLQVLTGNTRACVSILTDMATPQTFGAFANTSSGMTAGHGAILVGANSTNWNLDFSAELL